VSIFFRYMATAEAHVDKAGAQDAAETSRSLLRHLAASGLAVGSDISRVSVPVPLFLPKTMLEILQQNEMRRVDLLLQAAQAPTPLDRFKGILAYFFSCCTLEQFGRKPLYSCPGETIGSKYETPDGGETFFFAEQVPGALPTVAGVLWNEAKGVSSIGTMSIREEFWGMSVHAVPKGVRVIRFGQESYSMTPPTIAVRLTRGFSEFIGESMVECAESRFRARIEFVAKPLLYGETHAVRGQVINTADGTVLCDLSGSWAGKVWLQAPLRQRECIHAFWEGSCTLVPIYNNGSDTRLVWAAVKTALEARDWATAAEARHRIESEAGEPQPARYFELDATTQAYVRTSVPIPE